RYLDVHFLVAAVNCDAKRVSGAVAAQSLNKELLVLDVVAVNADDEVSTEPDGNISQICRLVPAAKTGALGGSAWLHADDEESVVGFQTHLLCQVGINGDGAHAERGAAHSAERHKVIDDGFGGVNRNGKTDSGALIGATIGDDHGVDTDDFSLVVEERAAGVSGVDGGVGLNGFVNFRAVRLLDGADGTYDSGSESAGEAEGIANGINLLANVNDFRIAERCGNKVRGLDLNDSEIVRRIGADDFRVVLFAIVQGDFKCARVLNNVVVGKDVAFFIDDEAGALPFLRDESIEKIVGDLA